MFNVLKNLVNDKKVLIVGFGREGKSIYNLLKKVNAHKELAIADKLNSDFGISEKVYSGDNYLKELSGYDIVFKSPGVVIGKDIDINGVVITSMIEQFMKGYGNKTIGITGTKGKSTVSSLIYHTLKNEGKDVIFAGNIGIPVFDIIDSIKEDTIIVTELSCHQLENCKYSPHIAVFLNIYEDHLDHYDGFDAYYNAKKNIYKNQSKDDILFCLEQVRPTSIDSKVVVVYGKDKDYSSFINNDKLHSLPFKTFSDIDAHNFIGEHNILNCNFAYNVVKEYGISDESFIKSVKSFKTLPHRLENIGIVDGVEYFDDSISTTAESCISAIKSIDNVDTVLIGGLDRGINYDGLISYLMEGKAKNVVLMYESGKRILDKMNNNSNINIYYCEDLKKAVEKAKSITEKGKVVVMSPAAASYGYFKNFEERGDKYKSFVYKENV